MAEEMRKAREAFLASKGTNSTVAAGLTPRRGSTRDDLIANLPTPTPAVPMTGAPVSGVPGGAESMLKELLELSRQQAAELSLVTARFASLESRVEGLGGGGGGGADISTRDSRSDSRSW